LKTAKSSTVEGKKNSTKGVPKKETSPNEISIISLTNREQKEDSHTPQAITIVSLEHAIDVSKPWDQLVGYRKGMDLNDHQGVKLQELSQKSADFYEITHSLGRALLEINQQIKSEEITNNCNELLSKSYMTSTPRSEETLIPTYALFYKLFRLYVDQLHEIEIQIYKEFIKEIKSFNLRLCPKKDLYDLEEIFLDQLLFKESIEALNIITDQYPPNFQEQELKEICRFIVYEKITNYLEFFTIVLNGYTSEEQNKIAKIYVAKQILQITKPDFTIAKLNTSVTGELAFINYHDTRETDNNLSEELDFTEKFISQHKEAKTRNFCFSWICYFLGIGISHDLTDLVKITCKANPLTVINFFYNIGKIVYLFYLKRILSLSLSDILNLCISILVLIVLLLKLLTWLSHNIIDGWLLSLIKNILSTLLAPYLPRVINSLTISNENKYLLTVSMNSVAINLLLYIGQFILSYEGKLNYSLVISAFGLLLQIVTFLVFLYNLRLIHSTSRLIQKKISIEEITDRAMGLPTYNIKSKTNKKETSETKSNGNQKQNKNRQSKV
jgi:hypothetical protein